MDVSYVLYILKCADGSLYTGITNDLKRRLEIHETGKGSKYVRARRPFQLMYKEVLLDKSTALKREYEVKRLTRKEKLALVKLRTIE